MLEIRIGLVGCFGFNGPLRQYCSLYRAVSQREGETGEKGKMRVKMSKQPPPAPTASAVGPCPTVVQLVGRPGTGSLPNTIAPPDHTQRIGLGALPSSPSPNEGPRVQDGPGSGDLMFMP